MVLTASDGTGGGASWRRFGAAGAARARGSSRNRRHGAPASVEVPLRIAVVQGGVSEKVIATKAYRSNVEVGEQDSVPFSFVIDDLVYPEPSVADADKYIFYIGFDPQALAPEPKPKAVRKRK